MLKNFLGCQWENDKFCNENMRLSCFRANIADKAFVHYDSKRDQQETNHVSILNRKLV